MRNYNEFPQLMRMPANRRAEIIALAGLSRHDETIARMRLIDGENIDVDRLYAALRNQAQRSPATVSIPLVGPITFTAADVDALYRHIKGA